MHTFPLQSCAFQELPANMYYRVLPEPLNSPYWIARNYMLAHQLGLPESCFGPVDNLLCLAGSIKTYHPKPLATAYAGHQFGVYVTSLGDGRAMLLGETVDNAGKPWEWQLKGAGRTPFIRSDGDGRAVLRSSIREYLCSEAMHGLGIPTTRALSITGSQDIIMREEAETAAIVTRIAPSFVRFGHFEYWYICGHRDNVKALADMLIDQHFPECRQAFNPYQALFANITRRTAELVAAWQSIGFCHGVLNTDNMSVLGLTIDYGPFCFLEHYNPQHVCNSVDITGRYAFNEQPHITEWNLSRLAPCFLGLVLEDDLMAQLELYQGYLNEVYMQRMRAKLGLMAEDVHDTELVCDLLNSLKDCQVDYTLFFRYLSKLNPAQGAPMPEQLVSLFHGPMFEFQRWVGRYCSRLLAENSDPAERVTRMNRHNPLYILRTYLIEAAIKQAENGDNSEISRLHRCMQNPFDERPEFIDYVGLPSSWLNSMAVRSSS